MTIIWDQSTSSKRHSLLWWFACPARNGNCFGYCFGWLLVVHTAVMSMTENCRCHQCLHCNSVTQKPRSWRASPCQSDLLARSAPRLPEGRSCTILEYLEHLGAYGNGNGSEQEVTALVRYAPSERVDGTLN